MTKAARSEWADISVTHRPGRHCGSSAIRDLLEFHGLNLSEAMCFGLGSGLGITYLTMPEGPIRFMTHVRSLDFESRVFEALGEPFRWETYDSEPEAADALDVLLDDGRPALLLTDIFHLDYFGSRTHFPGHAIVAWKRDPENKQVFVTDTERPDLIPVDRSTLARARFSYLPPFTHNANLYAPREVHADRVTAPMIVSAIRENASLLLSNDANSGIHAIETWRKDLPRWVTQGDWRWTTRFAYQVIEKRGTGGGGFRAIYAEFLGEAAELDKSIERLKLAGLMRESARRWTELANVFRQASESMVFPYSSLDKSMAAVFSAEKDYAQFAASL